MNAARFLTRYPLTYRWGNNPRRAELKGRRCRILIVGHALNSVLVEFENGERVVTSARAVY